MTIDNKHNFADAEVLLDNDHYAPAYYEPTAQPVMTTTVLAATPATTFSDEKTNAPASNSGNISPVSNPGYSCQSPEVASHNVQHKRNVFAGALWGVAIGLILLGPIGAVAGGFGGAHIVKRRERRWCRKNGWYHHDVSVPMTSHTVPVAT
jgi:hypothetical protein